MPPSIGTPAGGGGGGGGGPGCANTKLTAIGEAKTIAKTKNFNQFIFLNAFICSLITIAKVQKKKKIRDKISTFYITILLTSLLPTRSFVF